MPPYKTRLISLFLILSLLIFSATLIVAQDDEAEGQTPPPDTSQTTDETGDESADPVDVPPPADEEEEPAEEVELTPREERFRLPINSDVVYIAEAGDTLDTIGAFFDVSVACLREVNADVFDRDGIFRPGDELLIDVECPPYTGANIVRIQRPNAPGRVVIEGTYTVLPNDTLDTIAQELNISVDSLKLANDISDGRTLTAGQVLTIPEDAPPYGTFPAVRRLYEVDETGELRANIPDGEEYVVQPNDTLDTIAQRLNVSVISLMVENNLGYPNPDPIYPGDVLLVPDDAPPYGVFPALDAAPAGEGDASATRPDVEGETYVIQPGDTLDTIGQEFNASVEAIRLANNIRSKGDVQPGLSIIIPDDAPPYGVYPSIDQPAGAALPGATVYIIQPGDTLDGIAALFNVDTRCLIEQNQITNVRLIKPGQSVGIPSNCPAYMGFDVVPDTRPDGLPNVNTNVPPADDTSDDASSDAADEDMADEEMADETEAEATDEAGDTADDSSDDAGEEDTGGDSSEEGATD